MHTVPVIKRDFGSMVLDDFNIMADSVDWDFVRDFACVDDKLEYLNKQINLLFDIHAPLREYAVCKKGKPPYITYPILMMIREKNKLFHRYKSSKSPTIFESYKQIKNLLKFSVQEEKKAFFKHEIEQRKKNPKQLWRFFNEHSVHKRSKLAISEKICNASMLNEYFLNATEGASASKYTIESFLNIQRKSGQEEFVFNNISEEECLKHLNSLKTNAYGYDGINLFMLRLLPLAAIRAITHIINQTLESGKFPRLWKMSVVTPLAKVQGAEDLSQLRPINITSALSKLCEKVVFSQLRSYIEQHHLLPIVQSGFRTQHSTTSALLKITSDISRSINNNNITLLVSLDYSKAFERVDHTLLLVKLKHIGLSDNCISWLKSYLLERYQCVKLQNKISSFLEVKKGVPQGTILGPLLFTIYTSDIKSCILHPCEFHLYADDTQVYLETPPEHINQAIENLNDTLAAILKWSNNNGLLLNDKKTQAVCFGTRASYDKAMAVKSTEITIKDSFISLQKEVRSLGVLLDRDLSFGNHVNARVGQGFGILRTLNTFKRLLPSTIKYTVVSALIISRIQYCLIVYYSYLTSSSRQRLQLLQNCCFRYSYVVSKRSHITPFYIQQNILKLQYLAIENKLILIYKTVNNKSPKYLYEMLTFSNNDRNMRRSVALLPIIKHSSYKNSFVYDIAVLYNEFYEILLNCATLENFKLVVRKHMLTKQKRDYGMQ